MTLPTLLCASFGKDFLTCSWSLKSANDGSLATMCRHSENFSVTATKTSEKTSKNGNRYSGNHSSS